MSDAGNFEHLRTRQNAGRCSKHKRTATRRASRLVAEELNSFCPGHRRHSKSPISAQLDPRGKRGGSPWLKNRGSIETCLLMPVHTGRSVLGLHG